MLQRVQTHEAGLLDAAKIQCASHRVPIQGGGDGNDSSDTGDWASNGEGVGRARGRPERSSEEGGWRKVESAVWDDGAAEGSANVWMGWDVGHPESEGGRIWGGVGRKAGAVSAVQERISRL